VTLEILQQKDFGKSIIFKGYLDWEVFCDNPSNLEEGCYLVVTTGSFYVYKDKETNKIYTPWDKKWGLEFY